MPVPTLPSSISLSDIQTEFGGSNPIAISEYYAGGNVASGTTNATSVVIPSSGAINFSNFSGASAISFTSFAYLTSGTYTFTVPSGVTEINIMGLGGGGGGVRRNNQPRGGGGAGGALITVNNVAVQAAQTIWVSVGAGGAGGNQVAGGAGGSTQVRYTNSTGTVIFTAGGGAGALTTSASVAGGTRTNGAVSGTFNGGNGGAGGEGNNGATGGGGAGGYTGAGGNNGNGTTTQTGGTAGAGGGGGGSGAAGTTGALHMPAGGATSPFGSGANGLAGSASTGATAAGGGGSGGPDQRNYLNASSATVFWLTGTAYHWGAGGGGSSSSTNIAAGTGGRGACVITYGPGSTWPNPSFPVTTGGYFSYEDSNFEPFSAEPSITFNSNGTTIGLGSDWLISGSASDYEIRAQSLGTFSGIGVTTSLAGTYNSWLALSTSRTFGASISGSGGGGAGAARVLIEIRRAGVTDGVCHASVIDFYGFLEPI